jgi:hypothetical protein
MVDLLRLSLSKWAQLPHSGEAALTTSAPDVDHSRPAPDGGLILNVYSRIPMDFGSTWNPNSATGRDHLWLTREEKQSLLPREWRTDLKYPVPSPIAMRLARFHLVDGIRGEPELWRREEIQQLNLIITVENAAAGLLRLDGIARMSNAGVRGYDSRLQGYVTVDRTKGSIVRVDVLAWGEAWGEGNYTKGAPKGKFPLVFALGLAGSAQADLVPPQAIRNRQAYWSAFN